ncbi:Smad nuclear-interacting protein 1 [Cladochytrium replicatum]|nr:Smad nuclear-interacting protein 1 [Cladochytrium replicatum]
MGSSSREQHKDVDRYERRAERTSYGDGHRNDEKKSREDGRGKYDRGVGPERSVDRELERSKDRRRERSRSPSRRDAPIQDQPDLIEPEAPKEKPNFQQSGLLGADQNTFNGVVLKYSEPPEARKPTKHWRLFVFKGKEQVDMLHIHRQSAFLLGRERKIADIPIDHPSCSKQHAVLQFRQVATKNEFGETIRDVKPYIIDLESANGVFVNGEKVPPSRYYELKLGDVIKFGFSTREYVMMFDELVE